MVQQSILPDYALRHYVRMFQLGDIVNVGDYRSDGTVQSLTTTEGRFLLRLVQERTLSDARFEEALVLHLCSDGLPVLSMFDAGPKGAVLPIGPRQQLSVFAFPTGRRLGVFEIVPSHMRQVGRFLAAMHHAVRRLRRRRRNGFEPPRIRARLETCLLKAPEGCEGDLRALMDELRYCPKFDVFPRGIIHQNLNMDHVRFEYGELSEVTGFQRACTGPFLFDLANTMVEWCFLHDRFVVETARSLVRGYVQLRHLNPMEREELYAMCCYATLVRALECFQRYELSDNQVSPYCDYRHYMARLDELQEKGARRFFRQVVEDADEALLEADVADC